jgi:hypothetical protein
MKILPNSGSERVIDRLHASIKKSSHIDIATTELSLFAFGELREVLERCTNARLAITEPKAQIEQSLGSSLGSLLGSPAERSYRNRLEATYIAKQMESWLTNRSEVRYLPSLLPQSVFILRDHVQMPNLALLGACAMSTEGLGFTPGNQLGLVQETENEKELASIAQWFTQVWKSLPETQEAKKKLLSELIEISKPKSPALIYHYILKHLFEAQNGDFDEEKVIKTATGIKDTFVWKKLFRFQRDGVVGAIEKLERFGGCIIADSVGLGKTFEALAIIKYYELRNDRVLVLCPKRLRDNWTLYKANDRRNSLAPDRFNYDVLNHTDLSRDKGFSGDIDLANINWGNYDLVVIDESHNFRNKASHKNKDTRYDRLMDKVIRSGVKTRVLMLSATPVNNRLADLKNQIAFITEGDNGALREQGIANIETTIALAQAQFNRWLEWPSSERTTESLLDTLGFDYFKLLDLLTIARSRKHIAKYYGTKDTGNFPERLKPINVRSNVDTLGNFPSIQAINDEIRRLHLAVYTPLSYVMPAKKEAYERKYATEVRGGEGFFKQTDRENSLIQLMRVNVLKRMESSVSSFALTVGRQLTDVEAMIVRIDRQETSIEEVDVEDIDIDDPAFEPLLVGRKVKVLLADVDLIQWRQDLEEDRKRLSHLLAIAQSVEASRDAKLLALKELITRKAKNPININNRKLIVFTAFADTAEYIYRELSIPAEQLGLHAAIVTGTGTNRTTLSGIKHDLTSILTAFSPRSKERPIEFAGEGEIDLLIATDCISEGQNLQDCDYLVNYDIHWNPVRIIQRFGRIDRIGSKNNRIQLVNFWPNMELEEYIDLERRVSGKMVLLDISATGEENIIEADSGDQMHDLEYRREQLLKLQEQVIDLEDLSSGVSITDFGLSDFRIQNAQYRKEHKDILAEVPEGSFAALLETTEPSQIKPSAIFCLKAAIDSQIEADKGYPLYPYYLVYVTSEGSILLEYSQVRQILDLLKTHCQDQDEIDTVAFDSFERSTKGFANMEDSRKLLATALASITGKRTARSTASLFAPGGTHVLKGEVAGSDDFEVIAFLVLVPEYNP